MWALLTIIFYLLPTVLNYYYEKNYSLFL